MIFLWRVHHGSRAVVGSGAAWIRHRLVGSEKYKMRKRVLTMVCAGLALAGPAGAQSVSKGAAAANAPDLVDQISQPVSDWLERANREYQANVVHELSVPTGKGAPLEASQPSPLAGGLPALIGQVKEFLGMEPAKSPAEVAEAAKRDEVVKRQIEARRLEQERNAELQRAAEQQQIAAEAKKAAEVADQTTKQNQKAAEIARLAEEERRRTSGKAPVSASKTAEADTAKADEKAATDRAAAERKAVAAATEKAAADKVAAERKAVAAAEKVAAEKADVERKAAAEAAKVAADRAAAERKAVAMAEKAATEKADAERKAAAEAAKVAADKAAADRKAVAAADAAQRLRDEAAVKEQKQKAQAASDAAKKLAQTSTSSGSQTERPKPSSAKEATSSITGQTVASAGDSTHKAVKKTRVSSRMASSEKGGGRKAGRCSGAGRDVDLPATYVVKRGDTLWDISRRHYDKGLRFEKIVRANQDKIGSPDLIYPCQKFFLPGRSALYWVLPADDLDAS